MHERAEILQGKARTAVQVAPDLTKRNVGSKSLLKCMCSTLKGMFAGSGLCYCSTIIRLLCRPVRKSSAV